MGLTRNLPQLSNFQGRRRSLVLHSQAVILSGPVGVVYTKLLCGYLASSERKDCLYSFPFQLPSTCKNSGNQINWQGSGRGWASFWEPESTRWHTLRGAQVFLTLIFSSAPHSFLFPLFSIRGILEIKYSKQLLSKVNMSPSSFRFSESSFLLGSWITPPSLPLGN